jgi:hypothetical protein
MAARNSLADLTTAPGFVQIARCPPPRIADAAAIGRSSNG